MIGGFGTAGLPDELIDALIDRRQGARDLTVVNNNAGNGDTGLAALLKAGPRAQDHLQLPAPGRLLCSTRCTAAASSNWNWCRRATWPSASAPPARASALLHAHRLRHRAGRRARKRARSTAAS
jgi:hypothetical protein